MMAEIGVDYVRPDESKGNHFKAPPIRQPTAGDVLKQATETYDERHKVYGDNYKVVGLVMAALFPDGVNLQTADDHNRFHIFFLEVVKMTRYVQNWDRGGHEDSQLDLSVYAAMLVEIDREINGRSAPI